MKSLYSIPICFLALMATNGYAAKYNSTDVDRGSTHATTNSSSLEQEKINVSGIVTDTKGETVLGATVIIQGTTTGITTDIDGKFSLTIPSNSILEISFIGFKKQVVAVNNRTVVNVILEEDAVSIDEVVVVGYGTQKRVNVIGSIATIDDKQLANRATTNVTQTLTGQLPGVTISQAGGQPGVDTGTIRVRGVGSFGASPNPLVLIDGVPGDLNSVSPDAILSISILKDASSSAIYGSRAANGVVLVTTKAGKEQKTTISYNGSFGISVPTSLPQFVNSWEYAEAVNKADNQERYTPEDIQAMKDGSQPDVWANQDLTGEVFTRNGMQTGHDLSVTGGNAKNQFYTSFGYFKQEGLVEKNSYERFTGRINLTSQITSKIKMTARVQGSRSTVKEPGVAGNQDGDRMKTGIIQQGLLHTNNTRPSMLSSGNWGPGGRGFGSAQAWIASDSFYEKPVFKLNSNVSFDYSITDNLTLTAMGGYNTTTTNEKIYTATLPVEVNGAIRTDGTSKLTDEILQKQYKTFQTTLDYSKDFESGHNISVLAGYSWEDENQYNVKGSRDKFPGNDLPYLDAGSPDNQKSNGGAYEWALQSVFGRAQYNYKERYLAEITMRYDGSSRFPTNEKYGFFPSAALGWRVSEENFMKNNSSLDFINNLKIKASYGELGNNNIGNYPYQSIYGLGNNYAFGDLVALGAAMTSYNDPGLRWESTRTYDIGAELSMWNGLLDVNITYFDRHTSDILYKATTSVSSIFGLKPNETNAGEVSNKGLEIDLGHRNRIGDFNYNINANFTYIKNEVLSLGIGNVQQANGMIGNGNNLFLGLPMNMYYGYVTDGVFLDQADIDSYFEHTDQSKIGYSQKDLRPGDLRYVDVSGPDGKKDGVITPDDKVYLGSKIPKITFGLSLGMEWKGIDVSALLQSTAGVDGMLSGYAGHALYSDGMIQKWQYEGQFDASNPERYPEYTTIRNLGNGVGTNNQVSDYWVRNASYLRLKNLQVGYTIPSKFLNKIKVSNLRVYCSMENVVTWSNYPEGWDPETNSSGSYYPFLSTYVFGVNLKF